MLKRLFVSNLVAVLALFVLWVAVVLVDRRLVSIPILEYEAYLGLGIALMALWFANYRAYRSLSRASRWTLSIVSAIVVGMVWIPVAVLGLGWLMNVLELPH